MLYRQFLYVALILLSLQVQSSPILGMKPMPEPEVRQVALGKKLFFDRRLSANGTLSCAMCHIPEQGFAQNQLATPVGLKGREVKRNSPTLLNVAYRKVLFHDGREFTLENQVWSPLLASREMGNISIGAVINRIQALDNYQSEFRSIFNEPVNMTNLGEVLAAYERTLVAAGSPFDEWYFGKDESAVDEKVKLGYAIFIRQGCNNCHTLNADKAQFTDDDFHNTGIGFERAMVGKRRESEMIQLAETIFVRSTQSFEGDSLSDLGRYEMTGESSDKWRYRTPTLRNIDLTAPYMHDGSISTLEEVIRFYMKGGIANEGLDSDLKPFHLNEAELRQLLSFLKSLTSPYIGQLVIEARKSEISDY